MKERENRKRPYTRIEKEAIEAFCRACEDPTTRMNWKQRIAVLIALILAFFISYKLATASPYLTCDPQNAAEAGDRYEYRIDNGEWKVGGRIDNGDGTVTFKQDMAPEALVDGLHTFEVRACNLWGCGETSDPLSETKSTPSKALSPSLTAN